MRWKHTAYFFFIISSFFLVSFLHLFVIMIAEKEKQKLLGLPVEKHTWGNITI